MPFRTDYKGIHERAYQELRAQGRLAWSDDDDTRYRIERFAGLLESTRNAEGGVLVLGSGDGEVSIGLARRGFAVLGIDISATAVAWARERAASEKNAEFREGNVVDLSFLRETFAAAIDDHCFHCIIGPDRQRFLSGVRDRLRAEGHLILRTQCGDPPAAESPEFLQMWDSQTRCQVYNGVAGRYFGKPEEIIAEVASAGFKVIESAVQPSTGGWHLLELVTRKL